MKHRGAAVEVVLLCAGVEVGRWPLPGCVDLTLVDGLARLQMAARRSGCVVVVLGASDDLVGLLDLVGLRDVIPCERVASLVEMRGQAEEGEQVGVEEVVVPDDPAP